MYNKVHLPQKGVTAQTAHEEKEQKWFWCWCWLHIFAFYDGLQAQDRS